MFRVERSAVTGWTRWSWSEGVVCSLNPDLSLLLVDWPPGESEQTAAFYLAGPVLAFVLRGRGVCLLHGSVVTREGTTVAFLGDSGAGKSTLAAAMLDQGFSAVTDDLVALAEVEGGLHAMAGYAGLRLWPEAARGLGLDGGALPRLVDRSDLWPDWDKRLLPLQHRDAGFAEGSHRVTHAYVLGRREGTQARIEATSPSGQLMDLDRCVFQRYLRDEAAARRDLATLARLAGQAQVRRLFPSEGLSGLDGLVRRLAGELGFP